MIDFISSNTVTRFLVAKTGNAHQVISERRYRYQNLRIFASPELPQATGQESQHPQVLYKLVF